MVQQAWCPYEDRRDPAAQSREEDGVNRDPWGRLRDNGGRDKGDQPRNPGLLRMATPEAEGPV